MVLQQCLLALLLVTTASSHPHKSNIQTNLPVSVQRTKDCPDGSELVGKACVSTDILQPNFVCPPFATAVDGDCLTFVRALRSCPEGFVRSGDRCIRVESVPSSPVCDQGEISGNQCRVERPVPSTCPSGFKLHDGQCVRRTPQSKKCPPGFRLQGDKCVKPINFPASPVCPPDYSLSTDGVCRKSISIPPHCGPTFKLIGDDECVKDVPRVDAPCPVGFKSSETSCVQEHQSPPRPECPVDFALDGSLCIKEVPVPPTCPEESHRGSTEQCERSVPQIPVCENNEELVNGVCQETSVHPPELICPNGYTLAYRECKKAFTENPYFRCSQGALEDDKCVVRTTTPTRLQCPDGYQVDKGFRCVRDVPYECPRPAECEEHHLGVRNLQSGFKPKKIKKGVHSEKSDYCRSEVPCTKTEVVPVQFVCPNGSPPQGKTCNVVSSFPPQTYCKIGNLDKSEGTCVRVDVKPSSVVCRTGVLQPDETCLEVDRRPPILVCPDDSEDVNGRCIIYVPDVNHANELVRQEPRYVCDQGVKHGQICLEVEKVPRDKMCPPNSEDDSGRCVVREIPVTPKPIIVSHPPKFVCPEGNSVGQSCLATDVVPAEHVCLDGGSMSGSNCVYSADVLDHPPRVTYFPARPTCPPGYQQQGYRCSTTTSEPPLVECPPGFTRSEDGPRECRRSHDRIPSCPPGTEQTAAQTCVHKTYFPPRVTEIKVCTKGQPGC